MTPKNIIRCLLPIPKKNYGAELSLGFGVKTVFSSDNDEFGFEKSASSLLLNLSKDWILDHRTQGIIALKLLVINEVLFDPLNHAHGTCHHSMKAEHGIGPNRSERINNLYKQGPQGPCSYCLALTTYLALQEVSSLWPVTQRRKNVLCFIVSRGGKGFFLYDILAPAKSW